jgi:hypothetical protein
MISKNLILRGSPSSVNPERTIINFEISLENLKKINEKLREFYKRRLR